MIKQSMALIIISFMYILCIPFLLSADDSTKDLKASLALIPGLIDSPEKGPFVDLVKAIGANTGGKVKIEVYPFARSVDNVVKGEADFHVPTIRNRAIDETSLPYRFTTEKIGTVCFVIYSNTERPVTKEMIIDAQAQKGNFPYKFEVPPGLEGIFGFPCSPGYYVSSSLQKVHLKRIDALIWAQEEVDLALKNLKLNKIRREHWMDLDDTIIIQKGPHGDKVDAILSDAIKKLRASGQLDQLYLKVHNPYNDWQPSKMEW